MIKTIHLHMFFASTGFIVLFKVQFSCSNWFSCVPASCICLYRWCLGDVSLFLKHRKHAQFAGPAPSGYPSGVNDIRGCVSVATPSRWIYIHMYIYIYNYIHTLPHVCFFSEHLGWLQQDETTGIVQRSHWAKHCLDCFYIWIQDKCSSEYIS